MDQKDYFQLGAKLIGLYSLILALPVLLGILPTVIAVTRNSTKVSEQFGVQHLPLFAAPILLAILGFYLLKSRAFVDRFVSTKLTVSRARNCANISPLVPSCTGSFSLWGRFPGF